MITWDAHDMVNVNNSLDIYARNFSSGGAGGTILLVNSHLYGDQYAPRISSILGDYLIVWTSLGQDGSREGVFARFIHENGFPVGGEFQANTSTVGQQIHPVVASDNYGQFLVIWATYNGLPYNFDLEAQRYINVAAILQPMAAPFINVPFNLVSNHYQPQLQVSWPPLLGLSIARYEIYLDGSTSPIATTTNNNWTMTVTNGLTASSTNWFQVDYVTSDGRQSPISQAAGAQTWGGGNYFGIPFEWMEEFYQYNFGDWPANVNAPLVAGGPTLYQIFLSGGDPLDSGTWLKTTLVPSAQGLFLTWNTQPGLTYQVQVSTNLGAWGNFGSPRFANGGTDQIFVGGGAVGYYRVLLLRQ
jgi:hypothetical protein